MLYEQQISERRERAEKAIKSVLSRPSGQAYGDYRVLATSGKTYRVALRGAGLFESYCSCPDFAANTLGTCKHIEALLLPLRRRYGTALERKQFERTRASLWLHYGDTISIRLRLPSTHSPELLDLAREYFDAEGRLRPECYRGFASVLERLRKIDDRAVVYSDVLEFLDRENEIAEGLENERSLLAALEAGKDPLKGVLKTTLIPYQARGAIFAACRGRAVLADDMGLGKTVQALAAAELLRRWRGIARVLVIAPASVKYQWKTEIEKFTALPVRIVDGPLAARTQTYAAPPFFCLSSYELVLKDIRLIQEMSPDLVILDEAQRIRNWATVTARTVKQIKSRYAFVLTGTPLENKLEELYSVVEFVDGRRLGPAFQFLHEHRTVDEKGRLLGYRGLDRIHERLEPVLLRRTRAEVLTELPSRTDQVFRVPMTEQQAGPYEEQSDILVKLVAKWHRQGWISDIDLRRISCCLQNMRMLCNSTFLFDKQTHHSPKLEEFREVIREVAVEENRKVVVFSEYERMTFLAGDLLKKMGIGFVSLHGGVPGPKRGDLMRRFREDPECKVFLSTDAGGVGLNLQSASAVVNFEPPWNPARLEQRIGRVHRMGQSQPVQVIHFLTSGSIEERVWETLRVKKALFAGVFDSPVSEVSFEKLGKKNALQVISELVSPASRPLAAPKPAKAERPQPPAPAPAPLPERTAVEQAAGGLIDAGVRFLEALSASAASTAGSGDGSPAGSVLSAIFRTEPGTNRPVLSIPLPETVTRERLAGALAGLLRAFAGGK
jgi:SNF2 family DNA or RNA helicase